jgi:hypothetical protein
VSRVKGLPSPIYLLVIERAVERAASINVESAVRGGAEVILLVDDEQSVLKLRERSLKSFS